VYSQCYKHAAPTALGGTDINATQVLRSAVCAVQRSGASRRSQRAAAAARATWKSILLTHETFPSQSLSFPNER